MADNPRFGVDPRLVERAIAELPYRTRAFETLALQAYPFVRRIAVGIVGNIEDAENVTQEVMVRVFRGLPGFEGRSKFESWLLSIVYNTARTHLARRQRDREVVFTDEVPEVPVEDAEPGDFDQLIARLDSVERTIVTLRFREDLELREIAEVVGMKLSATKMRYYRALEKLRPPE